MSPFWVLMRVGIGRKRSGFITWCEWDVVFIASSGAGVSVLVAERKAHGIQSPPSRPTTRCVHSQVRLHPELLGRIRKISRWIIWRKNEREISFRCK